MRIAVTYDAGMIYQHYSRSPWVKIYDVFGNSITNTELVQARGFLRKYDVNDILRDFGVNVLITGRIGLAARMAVAAAGIEIRDRCTGNADIAVAHMIGMAVNPPPPKSPPRPAPVPKRTLTAPRVQQHRPAPAPKQTVMRQPAPQPARMPQLQQRPADRPMTNQRPQHGRGPAAGRPPQNSRPQGGAPGQGGQSHGGNRPQGGTPGNSRGGGFRK